MCGIAGLMAGAGHSAMLPATVTAMTGKLLHRGPDAGDVWVDEAAAVGLGHRRLSILGLGPSGAQPMRSPSGRYVLSYNGEIYNFRELRQQLEGLGLQFSGGSDTEVLVAALDRWGLVATLPRLIGMFAFALFDRSDGSVTLVRDRLGIKPVYYGDTPAGLAFASELSALQAVPGFEPEIDRDALTAYLRHACVPAPWCIYAGLRKLPAGSFVVLRPGVGAREAVVPPFWSAAEVAERGHETPFVGDEQAAKVALHDLLLGSVHDRLVADVPLGALLSGGVDSSLVVALAQSGMSVPLQTFSIGVADSSFDEAPFAAEVARRLGTTHTEHYVSGNEAQAAIACMPELFSEPFADSSQIPMHLVSVLARKQVTVCLSGDGGDELFGGYVRHQWGPRIWRALALLPLALRHRVARRLQGLSRWEWDEAMQSLVGLLPARFAVSMPADKLRKLALIFDMDTVEALYCQLTSQTPAPAELVLGGQDVAAWSPPQLGAGVGLAERMMLADLTGYLPDDILTKVDRASMGASLELRVPLLDHRVVEFAARLPQSMRIKRGQGKWLLREVLHEYLPAELFARPKRGFAIPLHEWLRGPLRDWAEHLLEARQLERDGLFNVALVRSRWREHLAGQYDWQHHLWTVLMFQAWRAHWHAG